MKNMGRIRDSVFLKTAAFIFQQIFFVIMFFSISIGITYWNYDDASFDILEQADFTQTNYYKRLVEENIYSLLTYIDYCEKFQTDGIRDTERLVDIYDYIQNDRITGKRTISLGYTIQSLLDWYQEGFYYITGESSEYMPEPADEGTDYQLVETYANDSGISLQSYAEMEQLDYKSVYRTLEEAAEKLSQEYMAYKKEVSSFKTNNTNLQYAMYNADLQQLYTNMNVSNIDEGVEQIRKLEDYVILNSITADFDSNLFYADEQLNHYLNALYLDNKNCAFAVGVNTEFPILDTFHKEELRYNTFEKWFQTLYKLLLVSIIGYVVCIVYLTMAAGHKKGREGITVTYLERVKTEFLAIGFLSGEIYLWYQISWVMSSFLFPSFAPSSIIRLLILSMSAGLLGMICYLSLLRRIKAKILWKNSLLYQVRNFGKQLLNKHLVWKVCLVYTLFLIVIFVSIMLTESSGGRMLVVLILLSIVPGWRILRDRIEKQSLIEGCQHIAEGELEFQIDTAKLHKENKQLGDTINQISSVLHEAVEDSIKSERLKTNLITNVSHDIKTPLTSIINYVALLKGISLENNEAVRYIQILDQKSQRLQHLTDDLVEASKISSGNITLEKTNLDLVELIKQTSGEFYEKFQERNLTLVASLPPEPVIISADGRRIWRILENIFGNALKYSLAHSRIYVKLEKDGEMVNFSLKNVSAEPLSAVDSEELTKRFVRGDVSRSTEGSGLGLSIARDLTELHGGILQITTDGDLFCIKIRLPVLQEDEGWRDGN
ncbi:MAG: GHKL domain-containing protein [Lachnospiraceae bacterium]|nr:GHKL domain-containing protein [Lachnospiraceae bacterium]